MEIVIIITDQNILIRKSSTASPQIPVLLLIAVFHSNVHTCIFLSPPFFAIFPQLFMPLLDSCLLGRNSIS